MQLLSHFVLNSAQLPSAEIPAILGCILDDLTNDDLDQLIIAVAASNPNYPNEAASTASGEYAYAYASHNIFSLNDGHTPSQTAAAHNDFIDDMQHVSPATVGAAFIVKNGNTISAQIYGLLLPTI